MIVIETLAHYAQVAEADALLSRIVYEQILYNGLESEMERPDYILICQGFLASFSFLTIMNIMI